MALYFPKGLVSRGCFGNLSLLPVQWWLYYSNHDSILKLNRSFSTRTLNLEGVNNTLSWSFLQVSDTDILNNVRPTPAWFNLIDCKT